MALGYWRVDRSASKETRFAELTPYRPRLRYAPLGLVKQTDEMELRHDR